jgi:hypothetical protein
MIDMFSPSVFFFVAVALMLALLPQFDICAEGFRRLIKSISERLHRHA